MERYAKFMVIEAGVRSNKLSLLHRERGIRLTLAPKSQKALSIRESPMQHGMVKLLGSCSFEGHCLYRIMLQASLIGATKTPSVSLSLEMSSLKNFRYCWSFLSFQERDINVNLSQDVQKISK